MTVDEIVKHTFCDVWNDTLKKYKINPTSQVFPRGYDIILEAISKCHLNENVTIKGGVVMRNISNDVRRATVDLDFDFIKKSISDDSIKIFINQLNTVSDVTIAIIGKIEELKQQEYKGKRVHISISDGNGLVLTSEMDIGVHKDLDITQEGVIIGSCGL